MKVSIYKRNTEGEESIYFKFDYDAELYDTVEKKFASEMWRKLVEKKFGHEYAYFKDYFDYTNAFNRFRFEGAGIYYKGSMVLSSEDREDGIRSIEIGNNLYFIV